MLGGVSAATLDLAYLPAWSLPELTVELYLPDTDEIESVTESWAMPLESAIRVVGEVTSIAGEVGRQSVGYRVRFRAGTDAERKASRLESELSALRRALPDGGSLEVHPVGQGGGEWAAVVWINTRGDNSLAERALTQTLEAQPEVREVWVAGRNRQELRIETLGTGVAAQRALDEHLAVRRLGEADVGGRKRPVLLRAGDSKAALGEVVVRHGERALPLRAMSEIRLWEEDNNVHVRLDGQKGLVYLVHREAEASPLAMERSIRETLERHLGDTEYRFLYNEAEPLRTLVERLLLGVGAAVLLSALLGFWLGGWRLAMAQALVLPVGLATALIVFVAAKVSLDSTTLPMLAVGLAWCLFLPLFRDLAGTFSAAVAAVLLPIGVALAAGRLAPLFTPPAQAFMWAQLAALVSVWIIPRPTAGRFRGFSKIRRPKAVGRFLRGSLRAPGTIALVLVTTVYILLVLFGQALKPQSRGNMRPAATDLRVSLRFAEGTTPEKAESQIAVAEETLRRHDGVRQVWSFFDRNRGSVEAEVAASKRAPHELKRLANRLQYQLNALGASAQVHAMASGGRGSGQLRFSDSLEARAETDEAAAYYTFILRSTDLNTLRRAHEVAKDRLRSHPMIGEQDIQSDWGRPSTRIELRPMPGITTAELQEGLRGLQARAVIPPAKAMTRDMGLRLVGPGAPETEDVVRQRQSLLGPQSLNGEALVPGALMTAHEVLAAQAVKRQAGRYVLPVTVRFRGFLKRFETRRNADLYLRWLTLPAGADIELPELNPFVWSEAQQRLLWIAGALPLLLWVLAACRLSSTRAAALCLVPPLVTVAAASPWIKATSQSVDEISLLILAAVLTGGMPLAISIMAAARRARHGGDYHWLTARTPALLVAASTLMVMLTLPGFALDGARHPWAPPMRLAAWSSLVFIVAGYFCLLPLSRAATYVRNTGARRAARQEIVQHWRESGPLDLQIRHATKIYGNGFQALRGVDFHLTPGIIGLLGPNGAGKTTLLRILCGILEPSRGQVIYRGHPITPDNLPEYRKLVGFLPQDFNAYEGFTGRQFLDYWALEKGILDPTQRQNEIEHRIHQVGLDDAADRKVRDYSGGMRRRIGIARALIGDPPIVIVDEPTTGLDVASRNRLRESLLRVAGERIIIFSTHIASDVAAAASRILLLNGGRMIYDGPARGLIDKAHGAVFETLVNEKELRPLSRLYQVTTRVQTPDGIRVRAVISGNKEQDLPETAEIVTPNLEEAYLAILGREKRGPSRAKSILSLT